MKNSKIVVSCDDSPFLDDYNLLSSRVILKLCVLLFWVLQLLLLQQWISVHSLIELDFGYKIDVSVPVMATVLIGHFAGHARNEVGTWIHHHRCVFYQIKTQLMFSILSMTYLRSLRFSCDLSGFSPSSPSSGFLPLKERLIFTEETRKILTHSWHRRDILWKSWALIVRISSVEVSHFADADVVVHLH